MLVKIEYPPIYDQIAECFKLRELPDVKPIFAWGYTIYNPHNNEMHDFLVEHERVHAKQQNGDPHGWWREYMKDQTFRLEQEIPAHAAEYACLMKQYVGRVQRRQLLRHTAERLAHPMYGYSPRIPTDRARGLLRDCLKGASNV